MVTVGCVRVSGKKKSNVNRVCPRARIWDFAPIGPSEPECGSPGMCGRTRRELVGTEWRVLGHIQAGCGEQVEPEQVPWLVWEKKGGGGVGSL